MCRKAIGFSRVEFVNSGLSEKYWNIFTELVGAIHDKLKYHVPVINWDDEKSVSSHQIYWNSEKEYPILAVDENIKKSDVGKQSQIHMVSNYNNGKMLVDKNYGSFQDDSNINKLDDSNFKDLIESKMSM